jgi:predicted membrane-bound mannosyltransferase
VTPQKWLLAAILLVAFVLRFWNLGAPKMGADESLHYFPEMQQIHQLPFGQQRIHPTDLYHATSPNPVGHPLFATQVVNVVMRILEPTEAVGRGVMALAGVLLVGMAYLLGRDLYDEQHGLIAAAIAALLPQAIRYQRTLYLDPIYSLLTAAWVWCLFRALRRPDGHAGWTVAAGVLLGLAGATKTSAPILLVLVAVYSVLRWWQERPNAKPVEAAGNRKATKRARRTSHKLMPDWFYTIPAQAALMVVIASLVFLVFVSPGSYLEAIRNPVDTAYQNQSMASYLRHFWRVREWVTGVAFYLWTPPVLVAAVGGLVVMALRWGRTPSPPTPLPQRERGVRTADALVVLWLIITGPLLFVHLAGLSGEHGYLSFVVPVGLLAAVGVSALPRRWLLPALALILVPMLPAAVLYGLRLVPTPYNSYLNNVDAPPAGTP